MAAQYELIFIFFSVIVGVVSAAYFYLSTGAFEHLHLLQRPIKWVAAGIFLIAIGVLMAAFISYEEQQGLQLFFYELPLQVLFYIVYIIGSLLILFGARQFTYRPHDRGDVVDVALQGK
jgi:putative Ca2+/H+ antiporter (TMEM165/GDT1 family)